MNTAADQPIRIDKQENLRRHRLYWMGRRTQDVILSAFALIVLFPVGPRPALSREVEQYGAYERQRLYVTPGLSCYWQIAPHRYELSFEEWMALDVRYIQKRSFFVDWKIIFRTFIVCLCRQGE